MEAIIVLCLLGVVFILAITWLVRASRRGTRDRLRDQFVSRVNTDSIDRMYYPTYDTTNARYPFPKDESRLHHPGGDANEASYRETGRHKDENLGDLPWD